MSMFVNRAPGSAHSGYRVTPARLVVIALFLRSLHWAVGCGSKPPDGQLGGDCKDNGCNTYCAEGVCDEHSKTCVAPYSPPPCPEDAGVCTIEDTHDSCDVGDYAVTCARCAAWPPEDAGLIVCEYGTNVGDAGETFYCCHDLDYGDAGGDAGDD